MSEDLIRRSDAIEAIECVDWYHQNKNKDMVSGANSNEHQAWYKAQDIYEALEAVPNAFHPCASCVDFSKYTESKGEPIDRDDLGNCNICKYVGLEHRCNQCVNGSMFCKDEPQTERSRR